MYDVESFLFDWQGNCDAIREWLIWNLTNSFHPINCDLVIISSSLYHLYKMKLSLAVVCVSCVYLLYSMCAI